MKMLLSTRNHESRRIKLWLSVPLIFALLALAGCIYQAPISLEPSREIDRSLLGIWVDAKIRESKFVVDDRIADR